MGGDIVGEAWGKSKERVEIPINNYKDRQTYYGALNLLEPDLILEKYSTGNGENTVKFVEDLQKKCRKKIVNILGWSQASYRREYAEIFSKTK
jgi:putative transposase